MPKLSFVYTTFETDKQAKELTSRLLKKKLIACPNMYAGVTSFYEWKGEMRETSEVVVVYKTVQSRLFSLKEYIQNYHPYETPCIATLGIQDVNESFLDWVNEGAKT